MVLLAALSAQPQTALALPGVALDPQPYVFACTAAVPEGATLQSLRVYVDHDVASIVANYFSNDQTTFDTDGSVVVQNNSALFTAAWNGASFSAEQVQGRIYTGSYTTDSAPIAVQCVRVETSDRNPDEFSLTCAPNRADIATATTPHSLYLTYQEGELEMFVNPTSEVEIFDLELASALRVSDNYVTARWEFHNSGFTAEGYEGDRFYALLYYRGLATYGFHCWKL